MQTPPPSQVQVDFKDLGAQTQVCVTVGGLNASEYNDIIRAYDKLSRLLEDAAATVG